MRVALGSPIEKAPNKSRQVYDGLLRLIMVGELSGGSVLAESQLAEHFGCSQATVRDALMRLQEDGLVQRAGYRGTLVCQVTEHEARAMADIRLKIELEGLGSSIARVQPANIRELRALIAAMVKAARAGDAYALRTSDAAFHLYLFRLSTMPALEPVLKRCLMYSQRAKMMETDAREETLLEIVRRHDAIVDALASGSKADV